MGGGRYWEVAAIGRGPLLGGGRYSEVYYNMGKRLELKISARYWEVARFDCKYILLIFFSFQASWFLFCFVVLCK